jgi:hypothetical protein
MFFEAAETLCPKRPLPGEQHPLQKTKRTKTGHSAMPNFF